MKAIIETGGKQYYVEEGSEVYVEKLDEAVGSVVTFDKVLMVNGVAGNPYVKNVVVKADVIKQGKQRKITIFKYRPKKNSHKKQGHRQPYTKVKITKIESL
ncbi:MAG TPA: 50S ribosomal protein L21 [Mollicutes bacterium]|jgi:large subunit ribosomal protein L21|nr:50S ribosomal protein L21 [Mollicutes bacterium]